MAIILKEETTLNSLVTRLKEKKFNAESEKKKTEEDLLLLRRKKERRGRAAFNKRCGWLFVVVALLLGVLAFVENGNFKYTACFCATFFVALYIIIGKAYAKRFVHNGVDNELDPVIAEKESQLERCEVRLRRVCEEISEHEAEFIGNQGEQSVISYVKENFGKDAYLINDITVKYRNKTTQIDHVLVCPRGVFCLETKNYAFRYYPINDDKWMFFKGYKEVEEVVINSPVSQSVYHAQMLAGALSCEMERIVPLVIFANPRGSFAGDSPSCKVIYTNELVKTVKRYRKIYSAAETQNIAHKILELNQRHS